MRLLQRYILYELLRTFAFLLSAITIMLVFVGVMSEVSEKGLGPFQVLQILPYVVPSLLPFTIPSVLLLTVCVVYGRMAGDQEITAAKAAGINVLTLLWPSFWLGAVLSVSSLVLTDQVIPWAVANIQRTVTMAMEDIFLDLLRSRHHFTDATHGYSIAVERVDGKTLIGPTFQYNPPGHQAVTLQAREATLEFNLDEQHVTLHMVHGQIDIPGQSSTWFEREDYDFPLLHEISRPKPRHLTIRDIRKQLRELANGQQSVFDHRDMRVAMALALGNFEHFLKQSFRDSDFLVDHFRGETTKFRTEIHSRFALSSSCIFFVLIGGPFAIVQGRRQFLTTFFLCFMPILLVYYPLSLLMINLSKMGTCNPAWAMWVGNVILLMAASVVMRKVLQH